MKFDAYGRGQQEMATGKPTPGPHAHQFRLGHCIICRNRRSVWEIATQPYSEAHFATFPEALVEPCILAGTSERWCCPTCGAGWERVVKRTAMVLDRSERTHALGRTRSSGTMLEPPTSTTTGWQPTCACGQDTTTPPLVLDPFAGSGTTLAVAAGLGRRGVGIEGNPTYLPLIEKRLRQGVQGFPDGWTCLCQPLEVYAADPDEAALRCTCPDSPRYRALGNAVTVNVIEWLGRRLHGLLPPR